MTANTILKVFETLQKKLAENVFKNIIVEEPQKLREYEDSYQYAIPFRDGIGKIIATYDDDMDECFEFPQDAYSCGSYRVKIIKSVPQHEGYLYFDAEKYLKTDSIFYYYEDKQDYALLEAALDVDDVYMLNFPKVEELCEIIITVWEEIEAIENAAQSMRQQSQDKAKNLNKFMEKLAKILPDAIHEDSLVRPANKIFWEALDAGITMKIPLDGDIYCLTIGSYPSGLTTIKCYGYRFGNTIAFMKTLGNNFNLDENHQLEGKGSKKSGRFSLEQEITWINNINSLLDDLCSRKLMDAIQNLYKIASSLNKELKENSKISLNKSEQEIAKLREGLL